MAHVTQKELALTLRLTTRQIRNLTDDGTLVRTPGPDRKLGYDLDENVFRYIEYRESRAAGRGSATKESILELQSRKLQIEVAVAELGLAKERGQSVTIDYMEAQIAGLLQALRARCLNLPGRLAQQLAQYVEPAIVQEVSEREVGELLLALSEAGDDPELDEADADEEEESEAAGAAL